MPNIIEYDGNEYDEAKTMAEAFNKHFTSVGRRVTEGLTGTFRPHNDNCRREIRFKFEPITREEIEKELSNLDGKKATGCDGIPPKVLKAAATVISGPVAHVFNNTLRSGQIPQIWKKAVVTPIHKGIIGQ